MATFNQQGQTVHGLQQNAETINNSGSIVVGAINNREDFAAELNAFHGALEKAMADKNITIDAGCDAQSEVKKALRQSKESQPEKPKLLSYLNKAKDLVNSSSGLVSAVEKLITAANGIF